MRFLFILFSSALFITACSTEAAQSVADEFHERMDKGQHDYIVENLIDLNEETSKGEWYTFLETVESWGEQKNRVQRDLYTEKETNGVKTVTLAYTSEIEWYELLHERIILVQRGSKFKVMTAVMNTDESMVIEQTENF